MKVQYKIALFAAVVFFVVVGGYFLTRSDSQDGDETNLVSTSLPSPTSTPTDNTAKPTTLASNANTTPSNDLNSLVRQQLAQINQSNKTSSSSNNVTPITTKPLTSTPTPTVSTPNPVTPPPAVRTAPATLTFDGTPVDDSNVLTPKPTTEPVPAPVVTETPKPNLVPAPNKPLTPPTPAVRTSNYPNSYTIQPNDTLSSIALSLYGSDRYWVEISQANPTIDPVKLKPGQVIKLPQPDDLRKSGPQRARRSAAGTQYTVRAGDNLSTIAQEFYNNAGLWRRIYNANKAAIGANPDTLQAGVTLDIPPAESGSNN